MILLGQQPVLSQLWCDLSIQCPKKLRSELALAADLGLILSTHMVAHSHL